MGLVSTTPSQAKLPCEFVENRFRRPWKPAILQDILNYANCVHLKTERRSCFRARLGTWSTERPRAISSIQKPLPRGGCLPCNLLFQHGGLNTGLPCSAPRKLEENEVPRQSSL